MLRVSLVQRMGSEPPNALISGMGGPGWRTARAARQVRSEIDLFSDAQRIFELDAKVAHRAVHLGVAK